jgi:alanyl-tRNA synthetase
MVSSESMVRVDDVVKVGEVILHHISGGVLQRGDRVKGMVDEERRWSLMRHHTATHIILHAAKEVLGAHIHQAGAQKGAESSRMDLRHFKHITPDELRKIETAANRMIMANQPVEISTMDRTKAEQKYGFSLYQGGYRPAGISVLSKSRVISKPVPARTAGAPGKLGSSRSSGSNISRTVSSG